MGSPPADPTPRPATPAPVRRTSARVLPVSPDGACLLLREIDPLHPEAPYWSSIGGGVDDGEALRAAAARELREEAGVEVDPIDLIGPIARVDFPYSWAGVDYLGEATYFAVALSREVEVSFDRLEPEEVDTVLAAAWWHAGDVVEAAHRPPALADLMRTAVAAVRGG